MRDTIFPSQGPTVSLADVYRRIRDLAAEAAQKRRERDGLRAMLAMDDHILRDIGVTRGDIVHCSRLPLAEDASEALHRLSARGGTML